MSDNIASQILDIARLAEAPPRDFTPWQVGRVIQTNWQTGAPVTVLAYTLPVGLSLVVTRVDSWVSEAYNPGTTPGIPKAVQPVINWPLGWRANWQSDDEVIAGRFSLYTVLGQGEQLLVFAPKSTARFVMSYDGPNQASPEQSFQFRFFGFLTLPEHAERLIKNQSLTPQ
jgi:hypothetical protein